jgi:hypothetical protein
MLTYQEIEQACKNIGYDITCGACAELFFTGVCLHEHDDTCSTDKSTHQPLIIEAK